MISGLLLLKDALLSIGVSGGVHCSGGVFFFGEVESLVLLLVCACIRKVLWCCASEGHWLCFGIVSVIQTLPAQACHSFRYIWMHIISDYNKAIVGSFAEANGPSEGGLGVLSMSGVRQMHATFSYRPASVYRVAC